MVVPPYAMGSPLAVNRLRKPNNNIFGKKTMMMGNVIARPFRLSSPNIGKYPVPHVIRLSKMGKKSIQVVGCMVVGTTLRTDGFC